MRIEAPLPGGIRLALGGDRIAEFDRNPAEKIMRFGVLWIGPDGIAQIDLRGLQVALFHGVARVGQIVRMSRRRESRERHTQRDRTQARRHRGHSRPGSNWPAWIRL